MLIDCKIGDGSTLDPGAQSLTLLDGCQPVLGCLQLLLLLLQVKLQLAGLTLILSNTGSSLMPEGPLGDGWGGLHFESF